MSGYERHHVSIVVMQYSRQGRSFTGQHDTVIPFDEHEKIANQNRTWRMRGVICMSLADLHRYITFSVDSSSNPDLTRQEMETVCNKVKTTAIPMNADSHAKHVEFVRFAKEEAPR